MSDQTNELLQQILEAQHRLITLKETELQIESELRISTSQAQKTWLRRQAIGFVLCFIWMGSMIVIFILSKGVISK